MAPHKLRPQSPADFPVTWEQPGDERLFWQRDTVHAPHGPLEYDLMFAAFTRGMTHAFRRYSLPIDRVESRFLNGHAYVAMVPFLGPPEEMEERRCEGDARIRDAMMRVGELWRHELLPEVQSHFDAMASRPLGLLSDGELHDAVCDAIDRGARIAEIHMEIVFPAYLAVSEFDELYRDLFEPDDQFESYRLLQGLHNKTTEMGHELWKLSRSARWSPEVMRVLEQASAAEVIPALRETRQGRTFLGELSGYLDDYGLRASDPGVTAKSWLEDPTPLIKNLKDYVTQSDSADPSTALADLTAGRHAAVRVARRRLLGYPARVREEFELMLRAAQEGIVISEDHGYYIDAAGLAQVRRAALEAGRRLEAAGAIGHSDDVFVLFADELVAALADPAGADLADTVAMRRAELEHFASVTPPDQLGTRPPGPPPDSPMSRLMLKFDGAPPTPATQPGEIRGSAGSAGKVVATARVIESLHDAVRLQPGEVLVTDTTSPAWTPLFASAAAVVTNTGGILSHCAVVAREYAIPAVVGAGAATSAIRDGQAIEVDGDAGVVRILDED